MTSVVAPCLPFECASCGGELPERFVQRRVPRLGGKRRRVCIPCAHLIDATAAPRQADISLLGEPR